MRIQNASSTDLFRVDVDGTGTFNDIIAPIYDASATYVEGDYVLYFNKFYKCIRDIRTAEAWTPEHWQAVKITDIIQTKANHVLVPYDRSEHGDESLFSLMAWAAFGTYEDVTLTEDLFNKIQEAEVIVLDSGHLDYGYPTFVRAHAGLDPLRTIFTSIIKGLDFEEREVDLFLSASCIWGDNDDYVLRIRKERTVDFTQIDTMQSTVNQHTTSINLLSNIVSRKADTYDLSMTDYPTIGTTVERELSSDEVDGITACDILRLSYDNEDRNVYDLSAARADVNAGNFKFVGLINEDNVTSVLSAVVEFDEPAVLYLDRYALATKVQLDQKLDITNFRYVLWNNEYSSSSAYQKGDVVYYNKYLYEANTAISAPAGDFDYNKWNAVTIETLLYRKQDTLTTTSVSDGENESFIGFDNNSELKKEKLLVMSPLEIINAVKGSYDPSKEYEILTVNDDPMSFGMVGGAQKSAVGDGNASLNKLVCVDVVKNQWAKNPNFTSNDNWAAYDGSLSISDGVATFTASEQNGLMRQTNKSVINGHKYLFLVTLQLTTSTSDVVVRFAGTGLNLAVAAQATTNKQVVSSIFAPSVTISDGAFQVRDTRASGFDAIKVYSYYVIDLTQRYGNNDVVNAIIGTGTDDEKIARLLAFDPEILSDLSYDEGTLVPSKTAKLLPVGVNQFAGNSESNPQYIGHYYVQPANNNFRKSSNNDFNCFRVKVLPSTKYGMLVDAGIVLYNAAIVRFVDKDFNLISGNDSNYNKTLGIYNTPANCEYIEFSMGKNVIYNICVFPYLDGSSVGFKPYKKYPVILPNYEGHGILRVVDGKVVAGGTELYPDGNSKKRYVIVDLGTLNWTRVAGSYDHDGFRALMTYNGNAPLLCPKLSFYADSTGESPFFTNAPDMSIGRHYLGTAVYVRADSYTDAAAFKSAMSGVYLVYKLATDEDITTPVFQSTFPVEQGGTLQFLDENDNPIAGLQGSEIAYLVEKGE